VKMRMGINSHGFTLLEIVITVVVTATLSALILQAMGTNVERSAAPLVAVRSSLSLQDVMENLTADYKRLFVTDSTPMTTFQSLISQNNTADGPYWSPYTAFTAQSDGIQFATAASCDAASYDNCYTEIACSSGCTIYRITITQNSTGRSLSALFTE
jgi:prepilin-type N-terminal cleavage/methylation domain-containing protein